MPRIRNITVAGIFAGATILGGAGLAGAADDARTPDPGITALQQQLEANDRASTDRPTTDLSTGEADGPAAPTLPEQAAQQARDALATAPAFGGDTDRSNDDDAGTVTGEDSADDDATADDARQTHGQDVSQVARSGEPGPGHGEAVSQTARQNGEQRRDAAGDADDEAEDAAADQDVAGDEDETDTSEE